MLGNCQAFLFCRLSSVLLFEAVRVVLLPVPAVAAHVFNTELRFDKVNFSHTTRHNYAVLRVTIAVDFVETCSSLYSSKPLGLFFCQFQLSRHMSSIPNCAFQPSSASAFAGLQ